MHDIRREFDMGNNIADSMVDRDLENLFPHLAKQWD